MKKVSVILRTTEVIEGIKRSPGDKVELADNDPIAVKTEELEKTGKAGTKDAG